MTGGLGRVALTPGRIRGNFESFATYVREGRRFLLAIPGEPLETVRVDPACLSEFPERFDETRRTTVRLRLLDGRVVNSRDLWPADCPARMRESVAGGPMLEGELVFALVARWSGSDPADVADRIYDVLAGRTEGSFEQNRWGTRQTLVEFDGVALRVSVPVSMLDAVRALGERARMRMSVARQLAEVLRGTGPGEVRWSLMRSNVPADIVHIDSDGHGHTVSVKHTRVPVVLDARVLLSAFGETPLGRVLRGIGEHVPSYGPDAARDIADATARFLCTYGTDVVSWVHPDGEHAVVRTVDIARHLASCRPAAAIPVPTRAVPRSVVLLDTSFGQIASITVQTPGTRSIEVEVSMPRHALSHTASHDGHAEYEGVHPKTRGTAGDRPCPDALRSPRAALSFPTSSAGISGNSPNT